MLACCGSNASAGDLVYEPINPNFGGNPFYGEFLLDQAQTQNGFEAPEPDLIQEFERGLTQRLLGRVSAEIEDRIFGENPQDFGLDPARRSADRLRAHRTDDRVDHHRLHHRRRDRHRDPGPGLLMVWLRRLAGLCILALAACTTPEVKLGDPPRLALVTPSTVALSELPPPAEPVVVAVYGFPDLTGQNKPNTDFPEYSSAVTKGGVALLLEALLEAAMGSGSPCWSGLVSTTCCRSGRSSARRASSIPARMARRCRRRRRLSMRRSSSRAASLPMKPTLRPGAPGRAILASAPRPNTRSTRLV